MLTCLHCRASPFSAALPGKPLSDMKFAVIGRLQQSKVHVYNLKVSACYRNYFSIYVNNLCAYILEHSQRKRKIALMWIEREK